MLFCIRKSKRVQLKKLEIFEICTYKHQRIIFIVIFNNCCRACIFFEHKAFWRIWCKEFSYIYLAKGSWFINSCLAVFWFQNLKELLFRHWLCIKEALEYINSYSAKEFCLLLSFYSFCNCYIFESLCHTYYIINNSTTTVHVVITTHKAHV